MAPPTEREFVQAVLDEAQRSRHKFPGNGHMLAALAEELGEVSKALLEGATHETVVAECVQVATVALRIATEGDADFGAETRGTVVRTEGPHVLVEYPEQSPDGGPVRKWEMRR